MLALSSQKAPLDAPASGVGAGQAAGLVWRQKRLPLKVAVGDLTVWSPRLDLMLAETPFADLPEAFDPASLPPPAEGIDGYLIRSCPADGQLWRIRRSKEHLLYAPRRYRRHWTAIEGGFDAYLGTLSAKTRSGLRRKVRKFEDASGGRDFRVYRTPAEMEVFFGLARPVSEKSYQERLMGAGLPATPAFREDMRSLAAAGLVRGYLLFHQGRPVAYTYGPVEDGVVIYDHTGFDPAHSALSPGTVLQFLILENLFAEGRFRCFDFTEGEGAHKALFGTDSLDCMDLYVLRPGLRTWCAVLIQTVIERGTERIAAVLDRLGIKRRLKRLLRQM